MNFFEKRPLSIILCILLGGFSLFALFPVVTQIILAAAAFILLIFFVCFIRKTGFFPTVCAAFLLVSFSLSFLYFNVHFPIYEKSEETRIEGRVCSIIYEESFGTKIKIKTDTEIVNKKRRLYKKCGKILCPGKS